jgi:uncharacterized membrane protein
MTLRAARHSRPTTNRVRLSRALLWCLIGLYIVVFGVLTILKHRALQTTAFDLGTMDQSIWNTANGRILQVSLQPGVDIRLAGHVEPILLVLSLLYLLYSDPEILLVLQTVVIALGALPIYWLAKERLDSDLAGLVFAAAFLLFPALEAANMFDFHGVTLAAAFLSFALYFAKREQGKALFLTFMVLTMSCREDMSLLAVTMGLYLILKWRGLGGQDSLRNPLVLDRDNWRLGAVTLVLGASWFVVALFVIPSHFSTSGQHSQWDRYGYLGGSSLEILASLLFRPRLVVQHLLTIENLNYVLGLLSPVAFLSLLHPQVLLIASPTLLMNLLSTYAPMHTLGPFHYAAPLVPFFIMSSIYGTARLARVLAPRIGIGPQRTVQALTCVVLLASLVMHYQQGSSPLSAAFKLPRVSAHERLAQWFFDAIPAEAAVSAQSRLVPHLSQRQKIYMFPRVEDAEYVFFDVTQDSWPIHPNDQWRLYRSLVDDEGFGVLAANDGYVLLRRGIPGSRLPDEFYSFARRQDPEIQYPAVVQFGDDLRLLGFDLANDGGETSLTTYWQALRDLDVDYQIYPFFYDETGRILEDTTLRPMTTAIWYPTSLWRSEEIVWMQTLPWNVGSDFYIGLGVMGGDDWSNIEERLPATLVGSGLELELFEVGTAVTLAEVSRGEIVGP